MKTFSGDRIARPARGNKKRIGRVSMLETRKELIAILYGQKYDVKKLTTNLLPVNFHVIYSISMPKQNDKRIPPLSTISQPIKQATHPSHPTYPTPSYPIPSNSITSHSSRIESNRIESNRIQSNPIQSNPIQSNPIQSNPNQSNPIQTNPIQSYPNQSNPMVWCGVKKT